MVAVSHCPLPASLKIVVAGCGISGLIAAISLSRQGHTVTILERARDEQFVHQGFHYHITESEEVRLILGWTLA